MININRIIDCFFIGHNEMEFTEYEKKVRSMGIKSGAYRDLNLNFLQSKNKLYTVSDIYNSFSGTQKPLNLGETFSATIAYLGTYLHRRNLSFDFVVSFQEEKEKIKEILQNNIIHAVAIPTTLYTSAFPIIEIVSFIRRYSPKVKIIIGGPFVSTNIRTQNEDTLQFILKSINADYYINSSQGEETLVKLLNAISQRLNVESVPNIYIKKIDYYLKTPIKIEDNKLSDNMVDWNLFKGRLEKFVAMRTAISCPFSCAFCGFPQHAGKYQIVDISNIEYELDALKSIGTVESINFIDDTFNVPPERFKEILRMMIRKKYNFKWHSYFRCQFADEEMIELMKESGCEGVFLGIESGSQRILNNMHKLVKIEDYYRGHRLLNDYNILTFDSFIVGFPGETQETVNETLQFIEELHPTFYRAQLWYCEPITPIWQSREKYGILGSQFEWEHNTMKAYEGSDWIEYLLLNVKNSIWLPQYNFDFVNIFHLLRRDMSLEEIKKMIYLFSKGLQEKIINPNSREISFDIMKQLKDIFRKEDNNKIEEIITEYSAEFEFL